MSPNESLVAETREWLDRAKADVDACAALIAAGLPAEALFHARQCAEKALKAVLTWRQNSFKKTHGLGELKHACLPLAPKVAAQAAHRILRNGKKRKKRGSRPRDCWTRCPPISNPSSVSEGAYGGHPSRTGRP
jgi:hypothetical protein